MLLDIVHVPLPILSVRVPVPEPLNVCIVGLLLLAEKSSVPVNAPIVTDVTLKSVLTVTVPPPEAASKVTVSPEPGTEPGCVEPPDVVAQLVRLLPSHVFVPPTQNNEAI